MPPRISLRSIRATVAFLIEARRKQAALRPLAIVLEAVNFQSVAPAAARNGCLLSRTLAFGIESSWASH
jgi:hypothetical protein